MELIKLLVAASSIILPLLLIVVFQMSAKKGMTISLFIMVALAFFFWKMPLSYITSSIIAGTMKSLTIIWILFGAIFLLNILRKSGMINQIIIGFQQLTEDKRIQLIIIGFYFIALLESASGFGAPAAIVAPLLVILGFSPVSSAALALIGNAVPMTFGAVGTPIIDGMGSAINVVTGEGFDVMALINDVAIKATFVDLFVGTFIPALQVLLLTTIFTPKEKRSLKNSLEVIPFALLSGLTYTSIAYISTVLLGPEFGALLGSLIGLMIIVILIRFKILIPKNTQLTESTYIDRKSLIKAWLPYFIVVILLVLSRVIQPLKRLLLRQSFHWDHILNTEVSSKIELLYSPGFILTLTAILVIYFYRVKQEDVKFAFIGTMISAKKTAFALIPALAMVYIFLNSGINTNALPSMPNYLATYLSNLFGSYWIFIAPFIGNLGTFISGSATTSNIMFSGVQYQVALHNQVLPATFLTAQALGANTGCMISISKVVSACAVVGLNGKEFSVLRVTLGISLLYALVIGIMVSLLLM